MPADVYPEYDRTTDMTKKLFVQMRTFNYPEKYCRYPSSTSRQKENATASEHPHLFPPPHMRGRIKEGGSLRIWIKASVHRKVISSAMIEAFPRR